MDTITKIDILFSKYCEGLGELQIRDFNCKEDSEKIHHWVTKPYAKYWGMQESSITEFEEEYRKIVDSKHHHVGIGMLHGKPIFLMEYYDPHKDTIADHYDVLSGDVGMHILVAPVEKKISKFTWNVFTTVMDFLFADPAIKRIVVEPNVANQKIHVLNAKAGFRYFKEVQLPHKRARLAICTRKDYKSAIQKSYVK
ncbi:GNAT family N-acetyltransferase [Aquimarina mytili]|uniref:Acetyltransferase n=1 Tax=Aquimarina mytili TaxID=874423 RepID=A0A937D854_9FLAO|nr:GNAT family N-acetyltransferase [Aquimarina mytili]MBL0682377.1 acetyltransferase [Aquimarina mytili]